MNKHVVLNRRPKLWSLSFRVQLPRTALFPDNGVFVKYRQKYSVAHAA